MSARDDTPAGSRQSGEWPDWLGDLLRRIERKIDDLKEAHGTHAGDLRVLEVRVEALEKWKAEQESDRRQLNLGTKLAIIAAIASPVAVILFEILRNHP